MIPGIAGAPPPWGLQVIQMLQALQQSIIKSNNASANAGGHHIFELNNAAGQSPAAAGIWFPGTLLELINATAGQENALIAFYGIALLPVQPGDTVPSRRKRTLSRHLGVRL